MSATVCIIMILTMTDYDCDGAMPCLGYVHGFIEKAMRMPMDRL